ncbi:heterokaryon incompatibility protein-domain-containing protein [Rhypophila decipiens]|uniref:Heterokaryon incompatibility protein-domain-containing protein n=1 Tax=Rhypophila decipiens TaxID=261697 RepID=A0AAN7B0Z5_9PEZI|nr:heterokaryon incompatibility protein-domain-containing protein [Rhypophila decipiens]
MASSPFKLCSGCQRIFSETRALTYGSFYHLQYGALTKEQSSCHLCDIVDTAWRRPSRGSHPFDGRLSIEGHSAPVQFALKVFNDDWARFGDEPVWPALDFNGDYEDHVQVAHATRQAQTDPTNYGLSKLLSSDAEELTDGSIEFWLCMVFADYLHSSIVLPLEIHTDDEAEAIAQINLEHQLSTGTPENMRLAKHWLRNCLENHPRCLSSAHAHARSTDWLPTRLLYVGSEPYSRLRLVSTAQDNLGLVSYAALSYRWGDQSQFCLTSAKIEQYHESIAFCELSKTLQEAVKTCRSIGLEYLWVDALCIVQGDFNDWSRESAVMSKVYGFATCTIAAANSGEDEAGCFATRNQYQVRPCPVPNPLNPAASKHRFYIRPRFLKDIFDQEVRQSAWYTRGWVFQERMLSSRLLIFGKTQMLWACQEIQAAESWPSGKTSENFIDRFTSFEVEKRRLEKLLDPSRHVTAINDLWAVLLRRYAASTNNFTNMSDRLVALQGLASQIHESTGRRYCAGLWLDDKLPASLLWIASGRTVNRPADTRAPSWSWASLDCAIEFNSGRFKGIPIIRSIQIPDVEQNPAGCYHKGIMPRLGASGHVLRVWITQGPGLKIQSTTEEMRPEVPVEAMKITTTIKLQSTVNKAVRRAQFTAKGTARKIQSTVKITSSKFKFIFDRIGVSSALYWAYDRLLEPLFLILFCPLIPVFIVASRWVKKTHRARRQEESFMMVPTLDNSKDPDLHASCFFDCAPPPPSEPDDNQPPTFIIPILDGYRTSGLIVQLVETPGMPKGGGNGDGYMCHYKRLGVFEMSTLELGKFRTSGSGTSGSGLAEETFYLL